MLKDKNSYDNRNLSEVFRELQQMQNQPNTSYKRHIPKSKRTTYKSDDLKLSHIITGCVILVVAIAIIFPKNLSFSESYAKEEEISQTEYELNRHRLNMQNIISENANIDRVKEQITEEREIEFETTYNNNPSLPKGEEIVNQEGINGKENVTVIQTFENGVFIEEIILSKERTLDPTPKLIDLGTSEFLAKHKVHLGDIMYLSSTAKLKKEPSDESADVAEIKQYLDVKLLELPSEEWCKVSFDTIEGYVKTSSLTSAYTTPNITEKNRIQRILMKVNIDMELNKSSGLTLNDYKKIFTNLPNDTNNIFKNNYTAFYNADKKYNMNGIFLASIAIHESAWGTSQIAKDKHNLFGYGAYDATPYDSSIEFADYSEGIETVAKSLVKNYLNPSGTLIFDGQYASSWYYNGPTLKGVNTRYASDKDWHTKVYSYMELLYKRLSV